MIKLYIRQHYILALIILLATLLRIYNIGFQSPWLDEIHTINEANPAFNLKEIYDALLIEEPHPPLYFYIVHYLFKIFGHTIETARIFSAVCGILGIYAIYLLGTLVASKRTGLIAALFLSVNSFHIYYSQDARPYAFFFLFTTLSIYWLIRFVNSPTWKNAALYGVFSALMLYGHFFGLLGLVAQYLVLLYIVLKKKQEQRKEFFYKSLTAGIVTLLLFSPSIPLFIRAASINEIWIPKPEPDIYIVIFKALAGNHELLTIAFTLLMFLYFFRYTSVASLFTKKKYKNMSDTEKLSFVVFFVWLLVVLVVPAIKSYVSLPMIVDRYFINVLPLMLLMAAIGVNIFKAKAIRILIVVFITVMSLTNITIIKKYYTKIRKTQFREATGFIAANNKNHAPVVTSLGWYMPFFFKGDNTESRIIDMPLENYIDRLSNKSVKLQPFWYIDGHNRPMGLSEQAQQFIDNNFYVKKSYNGFDIWTKYFVPQADVAKAANISEFNVLNESDKDLIKFNLEHLDYKESTITASGWAFFDNVVADDTSVSIALVMNTGVINLPTQKILRKDVVDYFKLKFNASGSGFFINAKTASLPKGQYTVGLYLVNSKANKKGLILTDKTIIVQ